EICHQSPLAHFDVFRGASSFRIGREWFRPVVAKGETIDFLSDLHGLGGSFVRLFPFRLPDDRLPVRGWRRSDCCVESGKRQETSDKRTLDSYTNGNCNSFGSAAMGFIFISPTTVNDVCACADVSRVLVQFEFLTIEMGVNSKFATLDEVAPFDARGMLRLDIT
uniref:Uncharacterized protein n=1 Tax=Strigamia maritima TaxID=126957 RepID=T1JGZ7_STRMM